MSSTPLVCLLPARNAAADLPGWLASVGRFADAVVALDDGSADETRALLAASPLVKVLLTNPPRADYGGWDDGANRTRLLDAAGRLNPEWIISLDADERIDEADGAAVRTFLQTDALPGCAYGFQHVPMRADALHHLPRFQWIYRLFAFAPGQRFPDQRLHFIPIPTSIPTAAWVKTTLRVQHLGAVTPARRLRRYEKYREADPECRFQADYNHLLQEPDEPLERWRPRPPHAPVLLDPAAAKGAATAPGPAHAVALSAIVIARDDEERIARTVASVVEQEVPEPFEVIVVTSGADRTAAIVRAQFPQARVVALPRPALPGAARNVGLHLARGAFVTFPGSHVELPPGSLAARLRAHRLGYAMVAPVTRNGTRTWAGWASYFLDHSTGLPGHDAGVLGGPPAHCSYARELLMAIGGFPEDRRMGEDTAVNTELFARGCVAYREPAAEIIHHSPCRTPRQLVRHHFLRGRGWGRLLLDGNRASGHLLNREMARTHLLHHVPRRLRGIARNVADAVPELHRRWVVAAPLVVAGAVSAWLGLWYEVLRPGRGKTSMLIGRPTGTLLLLDRRQGPAAVVALLRYDAPTGRSRAASLPLDWAVTRADGRPARLDDALDCGLDDATGRATFGMFLVRDVIGRNFDLDVDGYLILEESQNGSPRRGERTVDGRPGGAMDLLEVLAGQTAARRRKIATSLTTRELLLVRRLLRPVDGQVTTLDGEGDAPANGEVRGRRAERVRDALRLPGDARAGGRDELTTWWA